MMKELYTSDGHSNWLYEKYYAAGSNSRYFTFQIALNLLTQYRNLIPDREMTIIETGCQRQPDDLGAGMSTSIFAEWASRHGGHVISVDNHPPHLEICAQCVEPWKDYVTLICSDSIDFLKTWQRHYPIDLIYLDSLDYPIGGAEEDKRLVDAAQMHNLNEFKAVENKLNEFSLVLSDDNQLPYGGKPKLLKSYLSTVGWKLILDFQQVLFAKQLRK